MTKLREGVVVLLMILLGSLFSAAQQTVATNTNVMVPPLVNFSGVLTDGNGKPLTGVVGVSFYLYQEEQGCFTTSWQYEMSWGEGPESRFASRRTQSPG